MGQLKDKGKIRLNRFIALCGIASRRGADQLIINGQVCLNGKKVYELGSKVNPHKDKVTVAGRPVQIESKKVYFIFYKPKGVLSTMNDPTDRPTVSNFIEKKIKYRLFPVGRLDYDSEGLLILTNDGDYAQKLAYSDLKVSRTYLVKLKTPLTENQLRKMTQGVGGRGGQSKVWQVTPIRYGSKNHPWYQIILDDTSNEQLRKIFEKLQVDVLKLKRTAIGQLKLGKINSGMVVEISPRKAQLVFYPPKIMTSHQRLKVRAQRQKSKKRIFSTPNNRMESL